VKNRVAEYPDGPKTAYPQDYPKWFAQTSQEVVNDFSSIFFFFLVCRVKNSDFVR